MGWRDELQHVHDSQAQMGVLFAVSFRDDPSAEAEFARVFSQRYPAGTGYSIERVQRSEQPRTIEKMQGIAGGDFILLNYDARSSGEIRRPQDSFTFYESSELAPGQTFKSYSVLDAESWGALRQALGVSMPQMTQIQDYLHQGKRVFITTDAVVGLFANRPSNGTGAYH